MNIYDLANEELKRLYDAQRFWFKAANDLPVIESTYGTQHHPEYKRYVDNHNNAGLEIAKFRSIILDQLKDHDLKIQEKIAEMALTDTK